jgi:hypothetical protein
MLVPLIAFNDDSEQYPPAELDPAPRDRRPPHHGPRDRALGGPRGRGDHRGVLDPVSASREPRSNPGLDRDVAC